MMLKKQNHELTTRIIEVGHQRLRVGELKRGGHRPLLLFSGIGTPLEMVRDFSQALEYTDIITFDIPGIGGSPAPSCPYRLPKMAHMAARLLDLLDYETIDVLGISWGGGLAQQFVRDFPDRCRRLILAVTSAGMFMVPGKPSIVFRMLSAANFDDPDRLIRLVSKLQSNTAEVEKTFIKSRFNQIDACDVRGHLYQLLAACGWTSIHWLHRIQQPTLVLSGMDDLIVPPINGRILAYRIPNATLRNVNGGHLFLINKPEAISGMIEDFLREEGEFAPDRIKRKPKTKRQLGLPRFLQ